MDKISRRGFVKGAALVPLAFTPLTLEAQSTAPERNSISSWPVLIELGERSQDERSPDIAAWCSKAAPSWAVT